MCFFYYNGFFSWKKKNLLKNADYIDIIYHYFLLFRNRNRNQGGNGIGLSGPGRDENRRRFQSGGGGSAPRREGRPNQSQGRPLPQDFILPEGAQPLNRPIIN